MSQRIRGALLPKKLKPGDRVRFVPPASTPEPGSIDAAAGTLAILAGVQ